MTQLDFEAISAALEIEVNPEIPPAVLTKIISTRLENMTIDEVDVVPNFIWQALRQHLGAKPPCQVLRGGPDTIRLLGMTVNEAWESEKFQIWVESNRLSAEDSSSGLLIKGEILVPWTDTQLNTILSSILN